MQPWKPDESPRQVRRIGKTLEELSELVEVLSTGSRDYYRGVDDTLALEWKGRLLNEVADVKAQLLLTAECLGLDYDEVCNAATALRRRGCPLLKNTSGPYEWYLRVVIEGVATLSKVLARVSIQGLHERDPGTGLLNIARLTPAVGLVLGHTYLLQEGFSLNAGEIVVRVSQKTTEMQAWESHFEA